MPEKQRAIIAMLNGSYTLNDIVSKTVFDGTTGGRVTTYEMLMVIIVLMVG
mgnify:CR=1 FL=1